MTFIRAPGYFDQIKGKGYPPFEFFVEQNAVTIAQVDGYRNLIEQRSQEKKLDCYVRENKELIVNVLDFVSTGHQGAWVIPQQPIKTAFRNVDTGLIPDYLVCGKNSDGFSWWVIEFKGADEPLFTVGADRRPKFGAAANKGILQLLEYVDFCDEFQSTLREVLRLPDFRPPKGMLIIGREIEVEENHRLQRLKAAWNNLTGTRLEIRTHDALIRHARMKAEFHEKDISLSDFVFAPRADS